MITVLKECLKPGAVFPKAELGIGADRITGRTGAEQPAAGEGKGSTAQAAGQGAAAATLPKQVEQQLVHQVKLCLWPVGCVGWIPLRI